MSRLPTGIVTFLFTDIEGSTRRWEHAPAAMSGALARHDALIGAAVASQGGAIYKTIGDAFQIAFAEPGQALAAAVSAQRSLAAEDWAAFGRGSGQDIGPVRVRMALHTAPAAPTGSDYRTPQLNRVARLLGAGHGGQVLLTAATQAALGGDLPRGIRLRPLGTHRLKDLREPETIYQASAVGMPEVPLPLRTAGPVAPHDRIVVLEGPVSGGDAGRPVDQALADLGAVLRGEAESVTFSPQEIRGLVMHRPTDLTEYRLIRIAEWSQPRYRLDDRFVGLTLLVDQGEEAAHGRWEPAAERYDDLRALLAATADPALVVLGPPGSGKSTLLRHLEIELATEALRGGGSALTWFVPLSQYPSGPPDDPTDPAAWLAARWRGRYPALPPLDTLLAGGGMLLLLDGLNEIGAGSDAAFRACVRRWQNFVAGLAGDLPGNRVLFSCRSLDYSAPLSTAELRVPQVRIEPMDDAQVRAFLEAYAPAYAAEFWQQIEGQPTLALMRIPYLASLAIEQVARSGSPPDGVAELLTGFVRRALRREIELGNPLLEPDSLLTSRDVRQIVQSTGWRTPFELPQRGLLVPKLSELAYAMQSGHGVSGWAGNGSNQGAHEQVRLNYARTQDVLDHPRGEAILRAGLDLGVLDEDPASDEVMYFHQLVQEYFSARRTADRPDFGLVRAEWRAAALRPPLAEMRAVLPPAESLPPLPTTGWEETFGLAAPMAEDAESFLRALADANLALAGRCAASAELRGRLSAGLLDEIRQALVARTRDPEADLRARLAAGLALGPLGDPRMATVRGPFGDYRVPSLVTIPGGIYPIGDDAPFTYIQQIWTDHLPRHQVTLAPFEIGRFAVTNAEWACFIEAGGYDEERWWDTAAGRAWRAGVGTAASTHANIRGFLHMFRSDPAFCETEHASGRWSDEVYERWIHRLTMTEAELEAHLQALYPGGRMTEPHFWRDERFNHPLQPVTGINWHEARAYCTWLAAQTARPFRLPTEVEWEAAARGPAGRSYAYGEAFDPLRANMLDTHLQQIAPVGIFPEGDTPEGAADLCGNAFTWTSTAWGEDRDAPAYTYPYRPGDGREDAEAPPHMRRIIRGGSWYDYEPLTRAYARYDEHAGNRVRISGVGLRLVCG